MNYILLNNLILNHSNISDYVELKYGNSLTKKLFNCNNSCYCNDDYDNLINEIHDFLSDKTNVTLVVGTFFYQLPYFTELLSDKLKNIKIVSLLSFFIENNNCIVEKEEFVVNEVYDHFVIITNCRIVNKTLIIISKKLEQFDFENKLIEKIQWSDNSLSNVEKYKCIDPDKVISINAYLKENDSYFNQINLGSALDILLYNRNYLMSNFYHDVIETLKQIVKNKDKQLLFNVLLYLKGIRKKTDIWEKCWFNTTEKQTDYKNELKIEEVVFETQTLPYKRKFMNDEKFWLFAENNNFGCSFVRENSRDTLIGNFCIPNFILSKTVFTVNNKHVAKLFLDIKRDCFNNLNVTTKIEDKLFYSKIDF